MASFSPLTFTPREASVVTGVSLGRVQKAITAGELPLASSAASRRLLDETSVLALALNARIARMGLKASRQRLQSYGLTGVATHGALKLDLDEILAEPRRRIERLCTARDVLAGAGGVPGVALTPEQLVEAIRAGETAESLAAKMPALPTAVLEGLELWARANPLRGRPRTAVVPSGPTPAGLRDWSRNLRVTARQIEAWANSHAAQDLLPVLVRRLILANAGPHVVGIRAPGGDSTSTPSWDLETSLTSATAWVPAGFAGWEVSCEASPAPKATRDLEKRAKAVASSVRHKATFIAVTARRWPQKAKWVSERIAEHQWADVRAYDADDLELWLEQSPAVAAWLADLIGLSGHGVESLGKSWDAWACQASPAVTPEALFADREQVRDELLKAVRQRLESRAPPDPVGIKGDSIGEATAFAVASLSQDPEFATSSVVVTEEGGWRFVEQNPLIKVVVSISPQVAERPTRRTGLVIIIPFALGDVSGQHRGVAADSGQLRLPRPKLHEFERALSSLGVEEGDARRLAANTGRSWSVYRRQRATNDAVRRPAWLDLPSASALSTVCLLGSWSNAVDSDCEIVSEVAGRPYLEVESDLVSLAEQDDSPVVQIGPVWKAKSPLELLDLFGGRITALQLDRFFTTARALLSEPDPSIDNPEEGFLRLSTSKRRAQSGLLIRAIADTLIKLAVRGDTVERLAQLHVGERVERLVRELLDGADERRWLSLVDLLPALAEAAPASFLAAVERSLGTPGQPVGELMRRTKESGLMGRCWHASLLWSLEGLAWSPQWLPRVALILAQLAPIKVEGNWANTPLNTLEAIFKTWFPQTAATVEQRIQVLDLLINRYPEAGSALADRLANGDGHDIAHPTHRPSWRDDDAGAGNGATGLERQKMLVAAADRQIQLSVGTAAGISRLIEKIELYDAPRLDQIMTAVHDRASNGADEEREAICKALREKIHWHVNYSDRKKEPLRPAIPRLLAAYEAVQPQDPVVRHRYLFDDGWPSLPYKERDEDYRRRGSRLAKVREEAVAEILAQEGLAGVRRLALSCREPGHLGNALARAQPNSSLLIPWIIEAQGELDSGGMRGCISGLLREDEGTSLLPLAAEAARAAGWEAANVAQLLALGRDEPSIWDLAEGLGADVGDAYWRLCQPGFWVAKEAGRDRALAALLKVKRPRTALQLCRFEFDELEGELIAQMLEAFLAGEEQELELHMGSPVTEAIEALEATQTIDRLRLARLEFALFDAFGLDAGARAKTLYDLITREPELFAELITLAYKASPDDPGPSDEASKTAATRAWKVLQYCRRVPGLGSDGAVDETKFRDFVLRVRDLCGASGRLDVCDSKLGQIFAYAPADEDGGWPCGPVRDLLDERELTAMREGFSVGVYNKRGVFTKSYAEGGSQERELAERFRNYAKAVEMTHLNVAATLHDLARTYEKQARSEDIDAQLRLEAR